MIAAGTPTTLLTKLRMVPAADWPTGVYWFGEDVLRVRLVAARELPRDRTTLLVRLMAAGPLLASAVPKVARLARDAWSVSWPSPSCRLPAELGHHESWTSDEQEFLMVMQPWEDARTETRANDVLTVLRVRGIAVPDAVRRQIQGERDLARLERWLERAIVARSIAEVIDDLS